MIVDFYHLAASPLERVLPRLAERVLADGGRLLIVADETLLTALDTALWTYTADSFLPHGREGDQPILLSTDPLATNGARQIALADGHWREEALGFDRTFYFFDAAHLDEARAAWRALRDSADVTARFWKQDERGKWVQGP